MREIKKIEIEGNEYMKFPEGATLTTTASHGIDGILFCAGGHCVHAYSGELSSKANVEVSLYDNIHIHAYGGRKENPRIVITHDEWPCTIEIIKARNMKVIVREEQS